MKTAAVKAARTVTAQRVLAYFNLAMLGVKTYADRKRHGGHGEHSQTCECLQQCLPCIMAAARAARR